MEIRDGSFTVSPGVPFSGTVSGAATASTMESVMDLRTSDVGLFCRCGIIYKTMVNVLRMRLMYNWDKLNSSAMYLKDIFHFQKLINSHYKR